jgi:hypothetical protein
MSNALVEQNRISYWREGLQGGGVASLHRPVRGSRCPTPVLSSSGGLVRQPDISQATARTVIINFMNGYLPSLVEYSSPAGPFGYPVPWPGTSNQAREPDSPSGF